MSLWRVLCIVYNFIVHVHADGRRLNESLTFEPALGFKAASRATCNSELQMCVVKYHMQQ